MRRKFHYFSQILKHDLSPATLEVAVAGLYCRRQPPCTLYTRQKAPKVKLWFEIRQKFIAFATLSFRKNLLYTWHLTQRSSIRYETWPIPPPSSWWWPSRLSVTPHSAIRSLTGPRIPFTLRSWLSTQWCLSCLVFSSSTLRRTNTGWLRSWWTRCTCASSSSGTTCLSLGSSRSQV